MRVIFRREWMLFDAMGVSDDPSNVLCPVGEHELIYMDHPRKKGGSRWLVVVGLFIGAPEFVWIHWMNSEDNDCEVVCEKGEVIGSAL